MSASEVCTFTNGGRGPAQNQEESADASAVVARRRPTQPSLTPSFKASAKFLGVLAAGGLLVLLGTKAPQANLRGEASTLAVINSGKASPVAAPAPPMMLAPPPVHHSSQYHEDIDGQATTAEAVAIRDGRAAMQRIVKTAPQCMAPRQRRLMLETSPVVFVVAGFGACALLLCFINICLKTCFECEPKPPMDSRPEEAS
eukprot:GHVT01078815.1.p1 GENE.GHVT01078815.1~~GHVT01078815.1.p1  ORF type:complete len:200 (-),score=44.05 GHVT01078815.1:1559-2158(-)